MSWMWMCPLKLHKHTLLYLCLSHPGSQNYILWINLLREEMFSEKKWDIELEEGDTLKSPFHDFSPSNLCKNSSGCFIVIWIAVVQDHPELCPTAKYGGRGHKTNSSPVRKTMAHPQSWWQGWCWGMRVCHVVCSVPHPLERSQSWQ